MKKIFTLLAVALGGMTVYGQGYIDIQSTAAGIVTNTSSYYSQNTGNYTTGKTTGTTTGFYYALLYSTTSPTDTTAGSSSWTQVTQYNGSALAINSYLLAGSISGTGTSGGVQVSLAAGTTYYVELVGWSANLGTSWSTVKSELASGNWTANGYFGNSTVATVTPFATAGTGDPALFPNIWSVGTLSLYSVSVPEPGTMALAALGGASLLLFRRKK